MSLEYAKVIKLFNELRNYQFHLGVTCPTPHKPHDLTFAPHTGKKEKPEHLIEELQKINDNIKKINLPKNLTLLFDRKIKTFATQLTKKAGNPQQLFIETVCTPLKKELLTIYSKDPIKAKWILAGFTMLEHI